MVDHNTNVCIEIYRPSFKDATVFPTKHETVVNCTIQQVFSHSHYEYLNTHVQPCTVAIVCNATCFM